MAVSEQPELTVVVPAFNEAGTIAMVIERLQALPYELQIIVVDDCSQDGTAAIVEGLGTPSSSSATSATRARAPRCARASRRPAAASS